MKPPPIRVLIVDDHFAARLGLAAAIGNERDLEVVAQAENLAEACAAYARHRPDVVLMDYALGRESGVEAVRAIRALNPEARVLMLTVFDGEEDVFRAAEAGASGYLTKAARAAEVLTAIRTLARGAPHFPPAAQAKIDSRKQRTPLTPRELEILHLIVDGLSNKEIGTRLQIAEGTAKLHVVRLLAKLGAADRTRAAILAVERGMVRLKR